ncbi:hypothetical protein [Ktedonobacter sp. SOSP1-52]|uniref:hypothetical protein n=1 Tax=Ktedonobacter sp. SOSP1-52 TaxID=2778366 RepID=UPI001915B974|nr:hypothetical protein [Ktedonobacter sp. SOSP1-52]
MPELFVPGCLLLVSALCFVLGICLGSVLSGWLVQASSMDQGARYLPYLASIYYTVDL